MQRSALCRSRRALSNDPNSKEYLLAKIDFDTAENEPCEACPLSAYYYYYKSPRFESATCGLECEMQPTGDTCKEDCKAHKANQRAKGKSSGPESEA